MTTIYKTRRGNKISLLSLPYKAQECLQSIKRTAQRLSWSFVAFNDRIEVVFADNTTATYTAEENDYLCDEKTNDEQPSDE